MSGRARPAMRSRGRGRPAVPSQQIPEQSVQQTEPVRPGNRATAWTGMTASQSAEPVRPGNRATAWTGMTASQSAEPVRPGNRASAWTGMTASQSAEPVRPGNRASAWTGMTASQSAEPVPPGNRASAWTGMTASQSTEPVQPGNRASAWTGMTASQSTELTQKLQAVKLNTGSGETVTDSGSSDGSKPVGRGGLRGLRTALEVLRTRPDTCRGKKGCLGRRVIFKTNYFEFKTPSSWTLYQYHVSFNVDEERTGVRRAWIRSVKEKLRLTNYLFDGGTLFTPQRLSAENKPIYVETTGRDNAVIGITLKLVTDVQFGQNINIQIFNIIIRKCLSFLKLQLVGKNYFDAKASEKLHGFHVELWPGYITSIQQMEEKVLLCTNLTTKIMRLETAYGILSEIIKYDSKNYQNSFAAALIGQIVLTDYTNKTYLITDIDFERNANSTFDQNGRKISFVQYYKEKYGIEIKDVGQPLLLSRSKARDIRAGKPECIALIPELCRMTGLTDRMKTDFRFTSAIAQYTKLSPAKRMERLSNFRNRLMTEPNIVEELQSWNLSIDKNLVSVDGRILDKETIKLQGKDVKLDEKYDLTSTLRRAPMLHTAKVERWASIFLRRNTRECESFSQMIITTARGMNFKLPEPYYLPIENDRIQDYVIAIESVLAQRNPDFILLFVSNNRADRYSALKRICSCDRGVISQVVLMKNTTSKGVMSIATKISIQLNAKLGGTPWSVEIPTQNTMTMTVGFDVCHDPNNKNKSYGAFVASLHRTNAYYYSTVTHHANGEELSDTIPFDLKKALKKYFDVNNSLPTRIYFYRDGVGHGQIEHVYYHEVEKVTKVLNEVYTNSPHPWKLGYIIVTKRINTRIFELNGTNPPPGAVVDDVVTKPEFYDFYLISQTVREGTVTPTHYNIIFDNLGLPPDEIQRYTYKMTHLYYNWSGTVRVPATVQYAHKLAFQASQALHRSPHARIENYLHFL